MRYENPLYMAEDAGAAPESASDAGKGRQNAEVLLDVLRGEGIEQLNPKPMFPNPPGLLRAEPHSERLRDGFGGARD